MSRREFSRSVRSLAWQRAGGRCERCTAKIFPGNIVYDHNIPDGLGGEPTLENCVVVCRACDSAKTPNDLANIARAKRREAAHFGGQRKSKLPCGRDSMFRKKINGKVVRR